MRIAMVIGGFLFALFGIVVVVVTLMSLAIDNVLTIGVLAGIAIFVTGVVVLYQGVRRFSYDRR